MKRLLAVGILAICVIALVIFVFSDHRDKPRRDDSRVVASLRWVDTADAFRDVRAATERSDKRFLTVGGFASYEPGITNRADQEFAHSFGTRFLDGTSDVLLSEEHRRLNSLAISYAKTYNVLLLEHLKAKQVTQDRETSRPWRK
jgi:hypothetical protein